jgi:hypothetical protein
MTEAEWNGCADPTLMLEWLRHSGKASERRLRLFAAACCRWVWPLMTDDRSRRAVEVTERFADGMAGEIELEASQAEAGAAVPRQNPARGASRGTKSWRNAQVLHAVTTAAWWTASSPRYACTVAKATATVAKNRGLGWGNWQVHLLRCIFGNPFTPPPAIDPAWLAWDGSRITKMASTIYETRLLPSGHLDIARLGVLADALEEAGAADEEVLAHLRAPGPHVRGCFVVDAVLGKA